jgi:hypothetical protein
MPWQQRRHNPTVVRSRWRRQTDISMAMIIRGPVPISHSSSHGLAAWSQTHPTLQKAPLASDAFRVAKP